MNRYTKACGVLALLACCGLAKAQYSFTLVDAFTPSYDLRETYLFDMSEAGVGCGFTTIAITNGGNTSITYTGFVWTQESGKTAIPLSGPRAVNNVGQVAGTGAIYTLPSGPMVNPPGLPGTYGAPIFTGLNDAGVAVGYILTCNCSNSQGVQQVPYVWDGQAARTLAVPGATAANRINGRGQIVGRIGANSSLDGYLFDLATGQYTLVRAMIPGALSASAEDISETGLVTGSWTDSAGARHGYLWNTNGGVPVVLPSPPAEFQPTLRPTGVSVEGTVVGTMYQTSGSPRAFVYDAAHGVRDLNTLTAPSSGFVLMGAYKINDHGVIVGYGAGGGGFYKSFVLTPPPACGSADFDCDGDIGTDADIEAFFACVAGSCPGAACGSTADFNADGDIGTDADIEAFFRILSGGAC